MKPDCLYSDTFYRERHNLMFCIWCRIHQKAPVIWNLSQVFQKLYKVSPQVLLMLKIVRFVRESGDIVATSLMVSWTSAANTGRLIKLKHVINIAVWVVFEIVDTKNQNQDWCPIKKNFMLQIEPDNWNESIKLQSKVFSFWTTDQIIGLISKDTTTL